MQLGFDLGVSSMKTAWVSAALGAGPGAWRRHNHRISTAPSWIAMDGSNSTRAFDVGIQVYCGEDALSVCSDAHFRQRVADGEAVAWPRFPLSGTKHADNLREGLHICWRHALEGQLQTGGAVERCCMTASLKLERSLSEILSDTDLLGSPSTLPDFFASYLANELEESETRVAFVDFGCEALRVTLFRTWFKDGEHWVIVEEAHEQESLGEQAVHARVLARSSLAMPHALEFWLALEQFGATIRTNTLTVSQFEQLSEETDTSVRWVEGVLAGASERRGRIDLLLLRAPPAVAAEDFTVGRVRTVDGHDAARGAGLFGARSETPAHFVIEPCLYLSVNGSDPVELASSNSLLSLDVNGQTFSMPYTHSSGGPIELSLLWGPAGASGPLRTLSWQSIDPDSPVISTALICRAHRQGATLFGDIGVLLPAEGRTESQPWRLDMNRHAFWSTV